MTQNNTNTNTITSYPSVTANLSTQSISTGKTYFYDGAKEICLTDLIIDLKNKSRQVDCLTKILIQKGILTEEEINDVIASLDVMEKITKEE